MFRTAAYIEIVIENELPGLTWETYGGKHSIQKNFIERFLANAIYPILLILNGICGIVLLDNKFTIDMCCYFIIGIILFIMIIIIFIISYNVSTKGRDNEIEAWKKIINELK